MGRSRGGLTSKIHAVVDTNGLPVRLALTAGEAHDNRLAGKLLSRLKSGTMLLADRGYDASGCGCALMSQSGSRLQRVRRERHGMWWVLPRVWIGSVGRRHPVEPWG